MRHRGLRRGVPERDLRAADEGAPAAGRGAEALAIYEANLTVSKIGEYFIYAVFIFGFALLGLSDSVWKFTQTWVWLAVALYIVGIGLSHGVVMPTVKRMGVLMGELLAGPPPDAVARRRRPRSWSSSARGSAWSARS